MNARWMIAFGLATVGGSAMLGEDLPCQKPSESEEYCKDLGLTDKGSCGENSPGDCGSLNVSVYDRKMFPVGTSKATEGSTEEVEADCWVKLKCKWDVDTEKCVPDGEPDDDDWIHADKIQAKPPERNDCPPQGS